MTRAWWRQVGLIARRDLAERIRAKSYVFTTVLLAAAVAASIVAPALLASRPRAQRVAVVQPAGPVADKVVEAAGTGAPIGLVKVASLGAGRAELLAGRVDVVYAPGAGEVLVRHPPAGPGASQSTSALAIAIARAGGVENLIQRLPPQYKNLVLSKPLELPIRAVGRPARHRSKDLAASLTGLFAAIAIFLLITTYGVRIALGVGEEKASRVIEVLLATARPTQLLVGKVVGFGSLAFIQIGIMIVTGLACGLAVHSRLLASTSPGVVGVGVAWFVLGYGFYAAAWAAAGSLVTRQEDAYNVLLPLQIPLILGYALSLSLITGSPSRFDWVLAFLPPTAPIMMPMLYGIGAAQPWQVWLSAGVCLVSTVGVARVAATVYERAILRTGGRVRLRQVLGGRSV